MYWHRAGVRATERAATVEAISHFTKARELLATLPVSAVNRDQELETLTELGPSLTASVGYGAPEVMEVYTRALEVSRQLGEDSIAYSRALSGLWIYYMARGPHETAWEIARQLLTTAEGLGDPRLQVTARGNLADMCLHAGDFVGAAEHGRAGIALDHDHPRGPDDDDAGIMCRVWVSWSLHALGYADQAQAIADEALALGVTGSSALVRTEAWLYATAYQVRIRDYDTCRVHCAELGAIAVELDFRVFQALGKIYLGWVRASQGDEDGVDAIRGGIAEWRATGSSTAAPAFLAMLAEGCIATGRTTEALDATAEAIAMSEETGAKHSTAELYRLRGDALLQRHGTGGGPHAAEAEESYRRSIALAQEQRAKTWELRATMSLARLWNSLGKTTDARALFDDVYGWFTEGFDTPDLIDARALRETLT